MSLSFVRTSLPGIRPLSESYLQSRFTLVFLLFPCFFGLASPLFFHIVHSTDPIVKNKTGLPIPLGGASRSRVTRSN